jgi:hypothetical protein
MSNWKTPVEPMQGLSQASTKSAAAHQDTRITSRPCAGMRQYSFLPPVHSATGVQTNDSRTRLPVSVGCASTGRGPRSAGRARDAAVPPSTYRLQAGPSTITVVLVHCRYTLLPSHAHGVVVVVAGVRRTRSARGRLAQRDGQRSVTHETWNRTLNSNR